MEKLKRSSLLITDGYKMPHFNTQDLSNVEAPIIEKGRDSAILIGKHTITKILCEK